MYVDIVISNIFNLNKHFFLSFLFLITLDLTYYDNNPTYKNKFSCNNNPDYKKQKYNNRKFDSSILKT